MVDFVESDKIIKITGTLKKNSSVSGEFLG